MRAATVYFNSIVHWLSNLMLFSWILDIRIRYIKFSLADESHPICAAVGDGMFLMYEMHRKWSSHYLFFIHFCHPFPRKICSLWNFTSHDFNNLVVLNASLIEHICAISLEASITKFTFYHFRCFLLWKNAFTTKLAEFSPVS